MCDRRGSTSKTMLPVEVFISGICCLQSALETYASTAVTTAHMTEDVVLPTAVGHCACGSS